MATTDIDTEMSMAPTAEAEVENAAPAPAEQQMEQPAPEAQPAQQAEQQQPTPDAQPEQQMEQQTAPEPQPPATPQPRPQAPTNNGQAQPGGGHGVSMKALLEAGVHFGHQTKRWNPKMKPFIFTERNGIHILDLQQTVTGLQAAMSYVSDLVANGGRILFVGTKKQAQESIREESERANQPFINRRWMGGMLTNYTTIRTRLRYLAELEDRKARGEFGDLPKAEARKLEDQIERLNNLLGGIKNMRDLPDAVFIVDPNRERIAITESIKLGIPVVAMVDTNCDPDEVDYIIPSNDDAIRAVRVITAKIADAALEGQQRRETQRSDIDYTIEPGEYTFTPDDDSV